MFTCQDIQDQLQPGIEYEDLLKIFRKDYSSLRFLLILHFFSGILISFAELLQIFITYGDWRQDQGLKRGKSGLDKPQLLTSVLYLT